jgi:hypothetical protein
MIDLVPCCYTLISNQLLRRKENNVEHILDLFSRSLTKYGKQQVILINNPNGRIKAHCTNTHHSPLGNVPYLYTYPPTLDGTSTLIILFSEMFKFLELFFSNNKFILRKILNLQE